MDNVQAWGNSQSARDTDFVHLAGPADVRRDGNVVTPIAGYRDGCSVVPVWTGECAIRTGAGSVVTTLSERDGFLVMI